MASVLNPQCYDSVDTRDPDNPLPDSISDFNNAPEHVQAWILAGCFTIVATVISFFTIIGHLRRWVKPIEQVPIVRILFFVPLYAVISFLGFYFYPSAVYYYTVRDIYEVKAEDAFVIYSFFALITSYLGEDLESQRLKLHDKPSMKFPFPLGCFSYYPGSSNFFWGVKIGVLQYTVVRPVVAIASIVAQAEGVYCPNSMSPRFGYFWGSVINFISVSVAMYNLLTLYFTVRYDIKHRSVTGKFLAVKAVIFLTFWQGFVISILGHYGVIRATTYWTKYNVSNGLQAFLITIEMVIASIVHTFVFSSREYRDQGRYDDGYVSTGRPAGFFRALGQVVNPMDIVREFGRGLRFFWNSVVHGQKRPDIVPLREPGDGRGHGDKSEDLVPMEPTNRGGRMNQNSREILRPA
ncbi:hypothetical protein HKX48_005891 [Thoreauomyces humboldtii]|nr:hypothetical protein HKX48_005891 [Thoreauomyces humboldtii]